MIGQDNVTLIAVAMISLAGVGLTSWTQVYIRKHLGKTNGSGSIAEMVEHELQRAAIHRTEDRIMFTMLFTELGLPLPPLLGEEGKAGYEAD